MRTRETRWLLPLAGLVALGGVIVAVVGSADPLDDPAWPFLAGSTMVVAAAVAIVLVTVDRSHDRD